MTDILENRLKTILKMKITPQLKELGFKKNQLIYSRNINEMCLLVDIQKSQWNNKSEMRFTMNCGVYIPGILPVYANISEPQKPKIEHCSCSIRIGMLTPDKKDIWWKINLDESSSVDNDIAQEMSLLVENHIFPFLRKFGKPQCVAEFLSLNWKGQYDQASPISKAQRLAYSSIIYSKLGKDKKAEVTLNEAIEASKGSPLEDVIKRLKKWK